MYNYSDHFLHNNVIESFNNDLTQKLNLQNVDMNKRLAIMQILAKNMNSLYQGLDKSRINNRNLTKVLDVYRKKSIAATVNELRSKQKNQSRENFGNVNINKMGYNRDREINSGGPSRLHPRSEFTQFSAQGMSNNVSDMSRFSPGVQQQITHERIGQNSRDINTTNRSLEDLMKERAMDVPGKNRPGEIQFSLDKKPERQRPQQQMQSQNNSGNLVNDTSAGNYSDINFGNDSLITDVSDGKYLNENESIDARLKRMANDRNRMPHGHWKTLKNTVFKSQTLAKHKSFKYAHPSNLSMPEIIISTQGNITPFQLTLGLVGNEKVQLEANKKGEVNVTATD